LRVVPSSLTSSTTTTRDPINVPCEVIRTPVRDVPLKAAADLAEATPPIEKVKLTDDAEEELPQGMKKSASMVTNVTVEGDSSFLLDYEDKFQVYLGGLQFKPVEKDSIGVTQDAAYAEITQMLPRMDSFSPDASLVKKADEQTCNPDSDATTAKADLGILLPGPDATLETSDSGKPVVSRNRFRALKCFGF